MKFSSIIVLVACIPLGCFASDNSISRLAAGRRPAALGNSSLIVAVVDATTGAPISNAKGFMHLEASDEGQALAIESTAVTSSDGLLKLNWMSSSGSVRVCRLGVEARGYLVFGREFGVQACNAHRIRLGQIRLEVLSPKMLIEIDGQAMQPAIVEVGAEIDVRLQTIGPGEYEHIPSLSSSSITFITESPFGPPVPGGARQIFRFRATEKGTVTITFHPLEYTQSDPVEGPGSQKPNDGIIREVVEIR